MVSQLTNAEASTFYMANSETDISYAVNAEAMANLETSTSYAFTAEASTSVAVNSEFSTFYV
ncbi:5025_t:CDS:2, partial [Dentiscutata erythropus]